MSIDGMSSPAIGRALGVHETTVRRWFDRPEVMEEYRQMLRRQTLQEVALAHRNLKRDLETDNKKMAYLRQNATFFALNKYEASVMGENDGACTVTFVNGVPELGMPDPADDDEA